MTGAESRTRMFVVWIYFLLCSFLQFFAGCRHRRNWDIISNGVELEPDW